jgi:hypothetical protein
MRDGAYHEINLKECHAWTREGCLSCPDFAAEHADISTGGIGKYSDWTLTVVRTDIGREIIMKMLEDGSLIGRPVVGPRSDRKLRCRSPCSRPIIMKYPAAKLIVLIAACAFLIGAATAVLGMIQSSLLVGELHWVMQIVHLLLGLLTIGVGHMGAARYRRGTAE